MKERLCLIGFDEPQIDQFKQQFGKNVIAHSTLPHYKVIDGELFVDREFSSFQTRVDRVIFYGIFENDFDLLVALSLWGGACYPNPVGMMNCRLKHACLVRALKVTNFPGEGRGFLSAGETAELPRDSVAKWGNWHCGENKERIQGKWQAEFSSTIEPFFEGNVVRVIKIGDQIRQIQLTGDDWKKSIHGAGAGFMSVDEELAEDTCRLAEHFDVELIANDYVVGKADKYLLEVNHIPNVTQFPEIWDLYFEEVSRWCLGSSS